MPKAPRYVSTIQKVALAVAVVQKLWSLQSLLNIRQFSSQVRILKPQCETLLDSGIWPIPHQAFNHPSACIEHSSVRCSAGGDWVDVLEDVGIDQCTKALYLCLLRISPQTVVNRAA